MLKTIHRLQKHFLFYIVLILLAASMLFFGTDMMSPPPTPYAIKIDGGEISYDEFLRQRGELQEYFRQQFGPQYYSMLIESGQIDLNQQIIDSLIPAYLIKRQARDLDMVVSDTEVQQRILEQFGSPDGYRSYLRQTGSSAAAFEARLREQLLADQISGFLQDFSYASSAEAEALIRQQQTQFDLSYISLSAADLKDMVPSPSEEEIAEFYNNEATLFEEPARVRYDYVVFNPEDAEDQVEVLEEDIEFYYSDNQNDFAEPETVTVRHIQLNFPPDTTPQQMVETKEKAEEVLAKATAGEDFATLSSIYSDDIATKVNGGLIGTLTPASPQKDIYESAIALKAPGMTELVEADYGYHVVKVEEYSEGGVKPLEEVSEEIRQRIKKRDAPAYASTLAQEAFDSWQEKGISLAEFSTSQMRTARTSKLSARGEDPSTEVATLTQKILEFPEEQQRLIELPEASVLVEVKQFKEAEIPALEEIKEKVIAAYKEREAGVLAEEKARELSVALTDGGGKLSELAAQVTKTVEQKENIKLSQLNEGFLKEATVKRELSARNEPGYFSEPVVHNDTYYLVEVTAVEPPSRRLLEEQLPVALQQKKARNASIALASLIGQFKSKSDILIQPGLMDQ